MHKNSFYISFGVWLIILPLLGVPIAWKNILVLLSGVFLILISVGPTILKRLQVKSDSPSPSQGEGPSEARGGEVAK